MPTLSRRKALSGLAALCAARRAPAFAAPVYFPPPDRRGGWRTISGAAAIRSRAGIDLAGLDAAFDYAQTTSQHGGLLVVRHGHLVYERYFGRGHREAVPQSASCGKAVTSIAVGIGITEKRRAIPDGLDQKVFTPKYMPAEIFPLDDPRKADISLGQLLAMSAGILGINPGWVRGKKVTIDKAGREGGGASTDPVALKQPLWCAPGEGYSYATSSTHLASIVLRRLVAMEMQKYIEDKIARPTGWGRWGYALNRRGMQMSHTPGGGGIAMRSTDMLRFAYLLLREGRWGGRSIVPADFVRHCGKPSPYNPHYTHSLNFNSNADGRIKGASKDAFWKAGSGGYCLYVVPSLDMVFFKLGGSDGAYDPALTGLPLMYTYDGSRADWKPPPPEPGAPFSAERALELVVASVVA